MTESFPKPFGRYELIERLALGGMAELFLARVTGAHGFEKKVVIKRILPQLASDAQFTAMFISEAKITARLTHPKIAQTFELGQIDDQLYIAMEYVEGLDVLAMLREFAHRRERMRAETAVYVAHEVLDALDFAHALTDESTGPLGIVHRDVSPSNILVSRRGNVKLVDFGIAHAMAQEQHSQSGTLKGKYGYMSPEQVIGDKVAAASDLFSVGVVLAEMLMGRRLFAAPNELDVLIMVRDVNLSRLERLGRDIQSDLQALLRRALRKDPRQRFATAGEFRDALGEWLFQNRFRVTPRHLAEVVEFLYRDAEARRREMAAEPPLAPEDAVAAATDPAAAARGTPSPQVATEIDGIPVGLIAPDGAPPGRDREPPAARELPFLEDDLAVPEATPVEIDEVELSVRYPSISAAVASVAPPEPDPATREFDDSDLTDDPAVISRRIRRLPTAREVVVAPRPQPPRLEDIVETPSESGNLSKTPAIRVLFRLAVARAKGLLVFSVGGIRKAIYMSEGVPEYVSSNVAGELFGAYLVGQEAISEGELDMALAMMPHYGGKLGDTLVGLGLMKPLDVFRHLTRQVRQKLVDVCGWQNGLYSWYAERENPREAFPLDIDIFEVLGAGAMSLPEDFFARWLDRCADWRPRSVPHKEVVPEQFRLGVIARDVYNRLDGKRTVRELVDRYTAAEHRLQFLRVLFLLMHTDLARPAP